MFVCNTVYVISLLRQWLCLYWVAIGIMIGLNHLPFELGMAIWKESYSMSWAMPTRTQCPNVFWIISPGLFIFIKQTLVPSHYSWFIVVANGKWGWQARALTLSYDFIHTSTISHCTIFKVSNHSDCSLLFHMHHLYLNAS